MRSEVPQFKRCCFCIPLRRGLIGWGYAKLILNFWMIAALMMMCRYFFYAPHVHTVGIVITTCIAVSLLADASFNIVLIVAGHRKCAKLLRISYIYNLVWLGLLLGINGIQVYRILKVVCRVYYESEYLLYFLGEVLFISAIGFSSTFVQVYVILLLRSELIKLRKESLEMQFTNHTASGEPQCTLHASMSDAEQSSEQVHVEVCCTDDDSDASVV